MPKDYEALCSKQLYPLIWRFRAANCKIASFTRGLKSLQYQSWLSKHFADTQLTSGGGGLLCKQTSQHCRWMVEQLASAAALEVRRPHRMFDVLQQQDRWSHGQRMHPQKRCWS